ncbi:NADP-dependent oxidoreductase domain-containing protein [Pyronema domesticum]|nr:NADP-dependent oxidoreductase domain-containing protein [Pyronema domesticum]
MAVNIPTFKLSTGLTIPAVGYGCGTKWYGAAKDETGLDRALVNSMVEAIKLGYRHIDGAEMYGNEAEIGAAIKESGVPRDQLFITTKLFPSVKDPKARFDESLKNLGVDYIDLYLLHCPFFDKQSHGVSVGEVWEAIEALHDNGKGPARTIGVSNFLVPDLEELMKTAKITPAVNQIEIHPYCFDEALYKYCNDNNILLTAYGPLSATVRFAGGPLDAVLEKIGQKYGKTKEQVQIKWGLEMGWVVVTTTQKKERMVLYGDMEGWNLEKEEVEEIKKVGLSKPQRAFWDGKYKFVQGEGWKRVDKE